MGVSKPHCFRGYDEGSSTDEQASTLTEIVSPMRISAPLSATTRLQVVQDEGEEAYFAAFEAHDGDNFRCVDEDGFVDATETLAPGRYPTPQGLVFGLLTDSSASTSNVERRRLP